MRQDFLRTLVPVICTIVHTAFRVPTGSELGAETVHRDTDSARQIDVPEPPGVAALPRDSRGIPVPVHVGRPEGRAVRLTELDPRRLFMLTAQRRCTICGWKISESELCWYFSWPQAVAANERSGWQLWDLAVEGAGHKECMLYSALACPFLSEPHYLRRTDQRSNGELVFERGRERGEMTLVGNAEAVVSASPETGKTIVVVGGGVAEVIPFERSIELREAYLNDLHSLQRVADDEDQAFVELLTSTDEVGQIELRHVQVMFDLMGEAGAPHGLDRNAVCECGSGLKAKRCCILRHSAGALRARRAGPFERRTISPAAGVIA